VLALSWVVVCKDSDIYLHKAMSGSGDWWGEEKFKDVFPHFWVFV
jgi:hypothetical protein